MAFFHRHADPLTQITRDSFAHTHGRVDSVNTHKHWIDISYHIPKKEYFITKNKTCVHIQHTEVKMTWYRIISYWRHKNGIEPYIPKKDHLTNM